MRAHSLSSQVARRRPTTTATMRLDDHGAQRLIAVRVRDRAAAAASRPLNAAIQATTTTSEPPSLFIFGMGYTGRELARQAAERGWRVCGTTTATTAAVEVDAGATALAGPGQLQVVRFAPRRDGSDRAAARAGGGADALLCPAGRAALRSATHVLTSIPPVATPMYDPVLAAQLELLRWRLTGGCDNSDGSSKAAPAPPPPPRLAWIGYLSSTGVYGDRGGGWVDESADPTPSTARGVVRLEHEQAWQRWAEKVGGSSAADPPPPALRIFRLGGIYGPGRSVLEPLLGERGGGGGGGATEGSSGGGSGNGSSISGSGNQPSAPPPQRARRRRQRFTSRVHVADAARAALASAELWRVDDGGGGGGGGAGAAGDGSPPLPVRVYNVVDDLPAPRLEVEAYALERLREAGMAVAAVAATVAPAAGGAADADAALPAPLEEKRVRNERLKQEVLAPAFGGEGEQLLLYPDYRPAIDELVAARCAERGGS